MPPSAPTRRNQLSGNSLRRTRRKLERADALSSPASATRQGTWHATWAIVAVLLATLVPGGEASAQRSGGKTPPPPPPAGTILFATKGEARGIAADGTGSQAAFTYALTAHPVPSGRVYGTDPVLGRYWLAVEQLAAEFEGATYTAYELFAYRISSEGNLERIQVTALFPYVNFGVIQGRTRLQWSNDGQDSFVSAVGRTFGVGETLLTPSEQRDLSDDLLEIFRFNVDGAFLQTAFDSGIEPKFNLDDLIAGEWIESVLATGDLDDSYSVGYHHWSPDGTRLVYGMSTGLWVATLTPSLPVIHENGGGNVFQLSSEGWHPRWSPDGERIAFDVHFEIWTIKPDGTELTRVVPRTNSDFYTSPVWSPDGKNFALWHRKVAKGLQFTYYLVRVPSTGGSATTVYKGDIYSEKQPLGWHSNLTSTP